MTSCTICGERIYWRIYGPEGCENIVCEPCRALNMATWDEARADSARPAYIAYDPREWSPAQGGMPPAR